MIYKDPIDFLYIEEKEKEKKINKDFQIGSSRPLRFQFSVQFVLRGSFLYLMTGKLSFPHILSCADQCKSISEEGSIIFKSI